MKSNTRTAPLSSNLFDPGLLVRHLVQKRLRRLQKGVIKINDQWGSWVTGKENYIDAEITVHNPKFYLDILFAGSNGAASAWRDGFWTCDNITDLFKLFIINTNDMDGVESGLASVGNFWLKRRHKQRINTPAGSKSNIAAHYDLSNELFSLFLDDTMSYSAGIFTATDTSLKQASVEKLDRICRKLKLNHKQHILEIGGGWGGFAIHAASYYGCHITTTTISKQQYDLAKERIHALGLEDKIELLLCDYRDLNGQYDRLVSIEMIEAVGHEFLPAFFEKCHALLKDEGQMLIQAITMPDRRYAQYLKTSDFIQQFIFPGSCVPSISALLNAASARSELQLKHLEDIGPHYATTLRMWLKNFQANEAKIRALGFGDDFIRLWEYYFCYCEAGFKQKYIGDVQAIFNKNACPEDNVLGAV